MKRLWSRKGLRSSFVEGEGEEGHTLKRHLRTGHLTSIGIGAIIGAGIFVITGQAAALFAGPAVVVSFCLAALICTFTGLCYAELSSMIPVAGGSYSYSYVALGELPAWIIGWSVLGQYIISASTVSVGWSGYAVSFIKSLGVSLSDLWTGAPIAWNHALGWHLTGAVLNLPAIAIVLFLTVLAAIGIKAAAHFNNVMVVVKLATLAIFIFVSFFYIHPGNWIPFIPENARDALGNGIFGEFGWSGVLRASGMVFFAYIGFDTVATLAQETIQPQKSLPRGILGSLFICTIAYILTSLVLTGVVKYTMLNVADPMTVALQMMGPALIWLQFLIQIAIIAGLTTVILVQILGESRMFFAMSKDGLLPKVFSSIHHKTHTPLFATIVTGGACMIVSGLFPIDILAQFVSILTLFIFGIVCLGVLILRRLHPEFPRPFKVPFSPIVPLCGIGTCIAQMCLFPALTWMQFVGWIIVGLFLYFGYSIRHSVVQKKHHSRA
ncbi:MAG: amino acid permease [Verrucomicrobiota bacterium]|nr:amino acid permease [Verrucomicrobiota bacterium]